MIQKGSAMPKRTYLYWVLGAVIGIALLIGTIVLLNKDDSKPATTGPSNGTPATADVEPVKRDAIETPTDNSALANTLSDDAASIDNEVKNADNGSYDDSTLSDTALYN
jgi:hypothetical protein